MNELLTERVLRAVECVPAGRAVTFGGIAALVGTGPRQVGLVMSRVGGAVPWWRVVNARGRLPKRLAARARPHWISEGFTLTEDRLGVVLDSHRVEEDSFSAAVTRSLTDLPDLCTGE